MLTTILAVCLLLPLLSTAQAVPAAEFTNPILWEDFPDLDIFRVNDTFFMSTSNMHFSPGAPLLRSYDLVNWEVAGHSVPTLDFGPEYDLGGGGQAYVRGTWASYLNYRPSTGLFHWGGCVDLNQTHFYTAPSAEGPWTAHPPLDKCYYDAGLLIDDDDTLYVAYGNTNISVAQLTPDGLGEVRSQLVFSAPFYIEGARFYKIGGSYFIFVTRVADGQFVLRSTSGPFGPYEFRPVLDRAATPIPGAGVPHQGGLVQTARGAWHYMSFIDAYPGGRVPALAPVAIDADGWPVVDLGGDKNTWAAAYPLPDIQPPRGKTVAPPTGTWRFDAGALDPAFEWNHNPDPARWALLPAAEGGGLRLEAATLTGDLYAARNTLTRRVLGPASAATARLEVAGMAPGDRAGLALLRDRSAWVGVAREAEDGGAPRDRLVFVDGLDMGDRWETNSTGVEVWGLDVPVGRAEVWLRVTAEVAPLSGRLGRFAYSFDGVEFVGVGRMELSMRWQFFVGYRFAVFNFATQELGGAVTLREFELQRA